jgi:hypothetical protein
MRNSVSKLKILVCSVALLVGGTLLVPSEGRCFKCPVGDPCDGDLMCSPMTCDLRCEPVTMAENVCVVGRRVSR